MRAPRSLIAAAGISVGQASLMLVLDPGLIAASAAVVAILIVALVLKGSRVAWAVLSIGAVGEVVDPLVSGERYWMVAIGAVALLGLVAPASLHFVFRARRDTGELFKVGAVAWFPALHGVRSWTRGAIARLAGWSEGSELAKPCQRRNYGVLVWRLGIACVFLLLAVGATYNWEHDSAADSSVVHLIAGVTWTCYAIVQIAFLCVLTFAVYRHFVPALNSPGPRRSKP